MSPTLGGSWSNKLKGEQAEGEGIQTPEAGLRLGWKTVTPARTGGRGEGAGESVTPSWPSPGSRRAERGWVGPGREPFISGLGKTGLGVLTPHLGCEESPFPQPLHETAGDGAEDGGSDD